MLLRMIFRRLFGWLLVVLTATQYAYVGTADLEFYPSAMADTAYLAVGAWLAWALVVLLMVRRELPLGTGRFVLRMLGIDH
jgi:hypothetical protein